jgi:hypothetical protein
MCLAEPGCRLPGTHQIDEAIGEAAEGAIDDTMARLQDQGLRQMREMTAGIGEGMKKLQGRS